VERKRKHLENLEAQTKAKAVRLAAKEERKRKTEEVQAQNREKKLARKAEAMAQNEIKVEENRAAKRRKQEVQAKKGEEEDAKQRERLDKECEVVLSMGSIVEHFRSQFGGAKISITGITPVVSIQFETAEEAKGFVSQAKTLTVPVEMRTRPAVNKFCAVHFELGPEETTGMKKEVVARVEGVLAAHEQLSQLPVALVDLSQGTVMVQFAKEEDVAKAMAIMTDPAFRFDGKEVNVKKGKIPRRKRLQTS